MPASKSISNRVLVIDALGGSRSVLSNVSTANDTVLMQRLIGSPENEINVEDAGTTMRFLTAYFSVTGTKKNLTGTERMKLRPIGILVDALREIGARIDYLEKEGFPPIQIHGFESQKTNSIKIRGDVSSQYISALMMVAPKLPNGLHLTLTGTIGSRPYLTMTANLMRKFGVVIEFEENSIRIPTGTYMPGNYRVEADWSAASYWFSVVALADSAEIVLPNIALRSLQGDRVIVDIMEQLGVKAEPRGNDLLLIKKDHADFIEIDFRDCPDLAQTVAVVCAAKNITGSFTGLESLRIKETDRIQALQHELAKLGALLKEENGTWKLHPAYELPASIPIINTYLDHRMAMAFAPLAACRNIIIENPDVTRKSYPDFWKDMALLGFNQSLL